jgi:predicted enzyme related to lactoylglutathione lyase
MPHGKICYLEIPAKTAEASADAIADALKRIEAAGGRVLTPRTDIGTGMGAFAAFADPVGNEFGLYEEPRR